MRKVRRRYKLRPWTEWAKENEGLIDIALALLFILTIGYILVIVVPHDHWLRGGPHGDG